MSRVEYNLKSLVTVLVGAAIVTYLLYIYHPTIAESSKLEQTQVIPNVIIVTAEGIIIREKRLKLIFDNQNVSVYYKEALPQGQPEALPQGQPEALPQRKPEASTVLLLHGAAFQAQTWQDLHSHKQPVINSLSLVAASGYRAIAVDLPGHGKTEEYRLKDKGEFLASLIEALGIKTPPIIVSPSFSGTYTIPYIFGSDPSSCSKRAGGFVAVAPTSTQTDDPQQFYSQCKIPALIVYGELDKTLGVTATKNLRNMANSEVLEMKGARHPCYLESPDEWHNHLYSFLKQLRLTE